MFSDHNIDNMENGKKQKFQVAMMFGTSLFQTRYQTHLGRFENHEDVNQESLAVKGQPK